MAALPPPLHILALIIILFLSAITNTNLAAKDKPPYKHCPDAHNTSIANTLYPKNVEELLKVLLSSTRSNKKFYYETFPKGSSETNTAYALYLCFEYVHPDDCKKCRMKWVRKDLPALCPDSTDATIFEEHCQLRVATKDFFGKLDLSASISKYNTNPVQEPEMFKGVVNDTLFDLAYKAAFNSSNSLYAYDKVMFLGKEYLYVAVQCTLDLSRTDCYRCLQDATQKVLGTDDYRLAGGRHYSNNCFLRYEFYPLETDKRKLMIILVLAIALPCILAALVGYCVLYFMRINNRVARDFPGKDNPSFELATINAATDNFSERNLLGEGGFGPVFKGILEDGTQVAVKRLSNTSDQGPEEFKNEVLLILKLQHRNLVRLLGFCVEGAERLLVYELMPHGSLDNVLNDPHKRAQLTWSKRLDIVSGIARGILYLHEDSRLTIIHRDLKPGNVLLDNDLNPKISDFGNARIYGANEIDASTATVIGTYGYMAPEYAMEGIYSVKSDVFSFGIILLEIITGAKNLGFHLRGKGPSLQAYAWNLWTQGRATEVMDPLLRTSADACDVDEFLRCLHIGLLCVEEDASDRPTMSMVVQMLTSENVDLQPPKHPAFFLGRFTDHYETSPKMSTSMRCFALSDLSGR